MNCSMKKKTTSFSYKTKGTCSTLIDISLNGEIIEDVCFHGGCPGNLLGIPVLVKGRSKEEVIPLLKGICCGRRNTSCPDQLAKALESVSN